MDAAGIDRSVSPVHGWRHRLATSLMTLAPTAVVSTILGHASPTITRRLYQHAEGTHLEEAARKTAEVFDFSKAAKAK
jgi:integrase